jgi:hypothetical protein
MEGFSDGVFGFAITLLVLDLALHPPGTPLHRVLEAWPGAESAGSTALIAATPRTSLGSDSGDPHHGQPQ